MTGSVAGVFDVAQSGYSQWTDVLVDVEVTCEGRVLGSGGVPTAVSVLSGSASPEANGRCVIESLGTTVTASVATAQGCPSARDPASPAHTERSNALHVVRIPDSAVGVAHQLFVWADLERDGVHDLDETWASSTGGCK